MPLNSRLPGGAPRAPVDWPLRRNLLVAHRRGEQPPPRGRSTPRRRTPSHRPSPASPSTRRDTSASTVPAKPPMPKAIACEAPNSPMRTPSREVPSLLAMLNIEPMAATAKTPLQKPSAKTEGFSGQPGPTCAAATRPTSASAEPMQPSTVQLLSAMRRGQQRGGHAHQHHAEQHARILHARQRGGLARRQPEDEAGEGLEDQVLRADRPAWRRR